MPKIIAIDFGEKRTGIAHTDDAQIIASGLAGIMTKDLLKFLDDYILKNNVEKILFGLPLRLNGDLSKVEDTIETYIKKIQEKYPAIPIERVDERFTSKISAHFISQSGLPRKKRQDKHLLDKVSATIILQTYLDRKI